MNHPEYREGAYLFSPIGDDRPVRMWPVYAALLLPFVIALGVHLYFR